jgi:hypothetical protein
MKTLLKPFVSLALMGAFSLAACPAFAADQWTAGNGSVQISVNEQTGAIDHLIDLVSHEDYCHQTMTNAGGKTDGGQGFHFALGPRVGGLLLWDELRNKVYSDLSDPGTVTNIKASNDGGLQSLSFDKQYPGAEFVVHETFQVGKDGVRWNVRLHKTSGPDRTVRVVYNVPMPVGNEEQAWAPIAGAPWEVQPWRPFIVDYGQSTNGAVGQEEWRSTVPLFVFYSDENNRALAIASPLEVPTVRIRYLSNTSALADFYWNSRKYQARERPYFQISNEDLGLRSTRDLQTGLLISTQPANWRPALGWFYSMYKPYFDPSPNFAPWDGAYAGGDHLMMPGLTTADVKKAYKEEYDRGVRWEEYHSPYAHYGMMIPPPNVKNWRDISDRDQPPLTRAKIEEHCKLGREAGVGVFLYYNTTESEYWYAQEKFPKSIARSQTGDWIGAWRSREYPSKRACWLMNSDPSTGFGKQMISEARQMVDSYPSAAGFFWDVYGRSYMFDFAHDDGITMVDNRPAYYPEFMYERLMKDHIGPLLHGRGMSITANKPNTVAATRGVDGVMMMEDAPDEIDPGWPTAQSYLGLTRHVMILDSNGANAEMLYLECLRYGAFNSLVQTTDRNRKPLPAKTIAFNKVLEKKYQPFVNMFKGKKWVLYPRALELPQDTRGNIFRLPNGDVMITMVSAWRSLHHVDNYDTNLKVIARLPDAANVKSVEVDSVDLGGKTTEQPNRDGNKLTINVPKHGKATVILLHMQS